MCITRDLAAHRPQPKPFACIVAGCFDPPVVEHECLGPTPFEKQLAIIRAARCFLQMPKRDLPVELGFERAKGLVGHLRHPLLIWINYRVRLTRRFLFIWW